MNNRKFTVTICQIPRFGSDPVTAEDIYKILVAALEDRGLFGLLVEDERK